MTKRQLVLSKEFYLAVFTLLLGWWCLDQTRDLEGDAWGFPFYLSVILILLGVALLAQCLLDKSERKVDTESLIAILRGAVPFAAIAAAWTWALNEDLGYLLPSVVAAYAMLWVLGFATPLQRLTKAVMITLVIFTLFYIIFDSPLPVLESVDNFFNSIDQMMRE